MPIRNEQDKISYLLKDIENRINNQNTKIQLLQQRKKDYYKRCSCNSYKVLLCQLKLEK